MISRTRRKELIRLLPSHAHIKLVFTALAVAAALPVKAERSIDEHIRRANEESRRLLLNAIPLERACFDSWHREARLFDLPRDSRQKLDAAVARNVLPNGATIQPESMRRWGLPDRISISLARSTGGPPVSFVLVEGGGCANRLERLTKRLAENPPALDEDAFSGEPLAAPAAFPATVPLRIREIELTLAREGRRTVAPALEVEFLVKLENAEALASYFAPAYSREQTLARLRSEIGSDREKWISIRTLLRGWPEKWMNRFPAEMADEIGGPANDVCFGVAAQFFRQRLENGFEDRSTEATEWLLRRSYRLLSRGEGPAFGDYLYLPMAHAIRFILEDPGSRRWIGFSAWSSSDTPYRLWWVDQDVRSPAARPQRDPTGQNRFDIWRRRN